MTTDYDYDHFSQEVKLHLQGATVIVIVKSHSKLNNLKLSTIN